MPPRKADPTPDPAKKPKKRRKPKTKLPKFTEKRARGQPTLYDAPAHCARAKRLGLLGLTDNEIADQFGISSETLYEWSAAYPDFSESLASGKLEADGFVAQSHYQRAIGYMQPAVKIFPGNAESGPVYADYLEHYPGDVGAQKSWLHNRQPDRWRERKQVDIAGSLEHRISLMTPEERHARLLELQAKAAIVIASEATEVKE